jgi:uncharacterized membrane protein YhaH (DUF805 family)
MENYDGDSGMMAMGAGVMIFYVAILVLMIASMWKIFDKAGKPGWYAIIPIYSAIVFLEIVGKPWWWLFLFFIPLVGLIFVIIAIHRLSLSFGQGVGTTILLLLLGFIGFPMLAFGSAQYVGAPKD